VTKLWPIALTLIAPPGAGAAALAAAINDRIVAQPDPQTARILHVGLGHVLGL
jgi:hypothetical protein